MTVHPEHSKYDYIKSQKGELKADDSPLRDTSKMQLILVNHSNLLDFVFLTHYYQPIFTKVMLYQDEAGKQHAGVRELGYYELLTHACGLQFPQIVPGK